MTKTIGNPLSWTVEAVGSTVGYVGSVVGSVGATTNEIPQIRQLTMADLRIALRDGMSDFTAFRSDVVFACLLYPIIGAVLVAISLQGNMMHLLFPALSGFALAGPVAAVGLYEMSRRREAGEDTDWLAYVDVIRSGRFGAILVLALFHVVIFAGWIMAANLIFDATIGSQAPATLAEFARLVFTTPEGWAMIFVGMAVGFVFAVVVLAVSVVSFPLLLDRNVGLPVAVVTSVKVALKNPGPIAVWGLIVAVSLVVGSIPALLGLVVVMPILGHATWHLYRAAVN